MPCSHIILQRDSRIRQASSQTHRKCPVIVKMPSCFIAHDERMFQRLSRRTSLLRVEVETTIQEICEQIQFLHVDVVHPLRV